MPVALNKMSVSLKLLLLSPPQAIEDRDIFNKKLKPGSSAPPASPPKLGEKNGSTAGLESQTSTGSEAMIVELGGDAQGAVKDESGKSEKLTGMDSGLMDTSKPVMAVIARRAAGLPDSGADGSAAHASTGWKDPDVIRSSASETAYQTSISSDDDDAKTRVDGRAQFSDPDKGDSEYPSQPTPDRNSGHSEKAISGSTVQAARGVTTDLASTAHLPDVIPVRQVLAEQIQQIQVLPRVTSGGKAEQTEVPSTVKFGDKSPLTQMPPAVKCGDKTQQTQATVTVKSEDETRETRVPSSINSGDKTQRTQTPTTFTPGDKTQETQVPSAVKSGDKSHETQDPSPVKSGDTSPPGFTSASLPISTVSLKDSHAGGYMERRDSSGMYVRSLHPCMSSFKVLQKNY